tara:strand:- start:3442 stop:4677 length:1236 start_codon:yes stop_codon:yes gene_type:complete
MTKISSFKAIRPARDKAHLVSTLPFYTYKKDVLNAILADNPYSFLHIINPEFGPIFTRKNSPERFNLIKNTYEDFIRKGTLIQDNESKIYLYRQTKNGHEYTGVIAGASVLEYLDNKIKVHEATITHREEMFTNYLNIVGYNAEPVLLTYSDVDNKIDSQYISIIAKRPEYEFTTIDQIKHELWVLTDQEQISIQNSFDSIEHVYIADGHHRSASSVGLSKLWSSNEENQSKNNEAFLAFFINESRIHIHEFNRIIRNLNGYTKEEILKLLQISFDIKLVSEARKPSKQHELTMFIENEWFILNCKAKIIDAHHPVKSLDAQILTDYVLTPILNIEDLKKSKDIDFLSGDICLEDFEERIHQKGFKIGFVLYPINISEIKKVADNEMIMPPKSTWIEPKMRSGLTIYSLNE